MIRVLTAIMAMIAAVAPAYARQSDDFIHVRTGEQVSAERAYVLFRMIKNPGSASLSPVFLRIPTDEELVRYDQAKAAAFAKSKSGLEKKRTAALEQQAQAEQAGKPFNRAVPPPVSVETFQFTYDDAQNLFALDRGKIFQRDGGDAIYVISVRSGRYVVYGLAWGPGLHECFCFGTVAFDAKSGAVTDLGAFVQDRADKVSLIPELTAETGLGETAQSDMRLFSAAIRPVATFTSPPAAFAGIRIGAANYDAVGSFVQPGAVLAQRLAPLPGVLGYRSGHVVDLKTGALVPPNR